MMAGGLCAACSCCSLGWGHSNVCFLPRALSIHDSDGVIDSSVL
jgi:hypothetical protein